jgi:hypothetical protein
MKQIKTKSGDILCVENNTDSIAGIQLSLLWKDKDYKFLGKLSELTDKDCEEFVATPFREKYWLDYSADIDFIYELKSAKESFISLLQSEGIDTSKEQLIVKVI